MGVRTGEGGTAGPPLGAHLGGCHHVSLQPRLSGIHLQTQILSLLLPMQSLSLRPPPRAALRMEPQLKTWGSPPSAPPPLLLCPRVPSEG